MISNGLHQHHARWFLAAAVAVAMFEHPAGANPTVSCRTTGRKPQTIQCIVDQPVVNREFATYPQVELKPGDDVTLIGGGCVQVGGQGKTWKRFVDPTGGQADRLYYGTATIAGTGIVDRPFRSGNPVGMLHTLIPSPPRGSPTVKHVLGLGYKDDEYDDNSYLFHDDGDDDQCKGLGPAFVQVIIKRGIQFEIPPDAPPRPMDLVATEMDPNGFLFNPRWQYQIDHGGVPDLYQLCGGLRFIDNVGVSLGTPPCANAAPQMDDATQAKQTWLATAGLCWADGPSGHVNWDVATYSGRVSFLEHDQPEPVGDDDYNFDLRVAEQSGLTDQNAALKPGGVPIFMNLEFDSDEVVDHMDKDSWWTRFHQANDTFEAQLPADVYSGRKPAFVPWQMLTNVFGIVTGLFGTDTTHGLYTELHPLYSMALDVQPDAKDDRWAIFVRNWGDEGECAQNDHPLDLATDPPGEFFIRIPWRRGATDVVVKKSTTFWAQNGARGPDFTKEKGKALLLMFTLPSPESQGMVYGDLVLEWKGAVSDEPKGKSAHVVPRKEEETEGGAEARKLVALMTPAQRTKFDTKYRELRGVKPARRVSQPSQPTGRPVIARTTPAGKYQPQPIRQIYNRTRALRHLHRAEAICFAFDDKVPGHADVCPKPPNGRKTK